jgi:hypothetical protein
MRPWHWRPPSGCERTNENTAVNHAGHVLKVTVSLGVSTLMSNMDNAAALIKAADTALYQSKLHGRNQTSVKTRSRLPPAATRGIFWMPNLRLPSVTLSSPSSRIDQLLLTTT